MHTHDFGAKPQLLPGASVEERVLRAVSVDTIAGMSLGLHAAGGELHEFPRADLDCLPGRGLAFDEDLGRHHELAQLSPPARDAA